MQQKTLADHSEYLIEIDICDSDPVDVSEVRKTILNLGGLQEDRGFVFPSARRRNVVLDVLGDRFGERYFRCVNE